MEPLERAKLRMMAHIAAATREKEALDVVVVLDGSSSIGANDFNTAKVPFSHVSPAAQLLQVVLKQLVSIFNKQQSQFGLLQFSSNVKFETARMVPHDDLTTVIDNMQQLCGMTATGEALHAVPSLFATNGRPEAKKIVFVFTDGCPQNPPMAKKEADKLKRAGMTVFGVGIGQIRFDSVVTLSIPEHAFRVANFDSLLAFFTDVQRRIVSIAQQYAIQVHCEVGSRDAEHLFSVANCDVGFPHWHWRGYEDGVGHCQHWALHTACSSYQGWPRWRYLVFR